MLPCQRSPPPPQLLCLACPLRRIPSPRSSRLSKSHQVQLRHFSRVQGQLPHMMGPLPAVQIITPMRWSVVITDTPNRSTSAQADSANVLPLERLDVSSMSHLSVREYTFSPAAWSVAQRCDRKPRLSLIVHILDAYIKTSPLIRAESTTSLSSPITIEMHYTNRCTSEPSVSPTISKLPYVGGLPSYVVLQLTPFVSSGVSYPASASPLRAAAALGTLSIPHPSPTNTPPNPYKTGVILGSISIVVVAIATIISLAFYFTCLWKKCGCRGYHSWHRSRRAGRRIVIVSYSIFMSRNAWISSFAVRTWTLRLKVSKVLKLEIGALLKLFNLLASPMERAL